MTSLPRLAACVALAAATLASTGCQRPTAQAEPPTPTVGVVESRRMTVPILANPTGTTRALEEVSIRARVRGFLMERHFEEGSNVKKGQLLLVIEEEPYVIALQSAQAKLAEAEASLDKVEHSKDREVAAAQLALDEAQLTLAQIEERRSRALVSRNAAAREDLDKAEAERKKYEAQVQADRAKYEQAKSDYEVNILAAKARVADAEATVRNAELDLSYCRMYAPITGRIGEAKIKVGNLVGPSSPGGSDNTVLATIQQLDPMGVDIQVSSRYLDRATRLIKRGLKARLTRPGIEGEQEHPYEAECYFIDNAIDPTTSTFLAKARVKNPDGSLLPGEYVKLRIEVDRIENAVVVPEEAVMETQAGPVVYIVDRDGKVAIQRVEAAQTYEGLRVILNGLNSGLPVIVEGLQMVRPGMAAKTEPAVLPRPVRRVPGGGVKGPSAAQKEGEGEAPNPDAAKGKAAEPPKRGRAEPPAVQPGGPRSAVKAEEDLEAARKSPARSPAGAP